MKKLSVVFLLIALVCSCDKNQIDLPVQEEDKVEVEGGSQTGELPEVIYASMSDEEQSPETRTYVDGNRKDVLWQKDDAISYFAGKVHNAKYVYNGETPSTKVELDKVEQTGTEIALIEYSRGIYPYDAEATVVYEGGIDKINVTYPSTQTYAQNSFGIGANLMIATGNSNQDDQLYFRNACGYLVIQLYGADTKVKTVTLSSLSGTDKIAGKALIVTDEDKLPVITMSDDASTAVTLDCSNGGEGVALGATKEDATEFWFALPPVNFDGGIKIIVTDMNDQSYNMQTTKSVNITRNNVQPMAALQFVSNVPASNKIWYTKTAEAMAAEGGKNPTQFYDHEDAPNPFDATIKAHYFDETAGKFVIEFTSPVTTIQEYAFRNTQIETISLPEGLVTIEREAFRNTPLTEITIPGSVNTIEIDAFFHCYKLTSVTFAPSATKTPLSIGYQIAASSEYGPFYDSPLTAINFNRELVYKKSNDEDFTPDEEDEGIFYSHYQNDENPVTVTIGNQVNTIHNYMFSHLHIQTLTIPGTVATIGHDAFNGCDKLTSLTFEPSPTDEILTIGYNTVGDDEGLFIDSPLATIKLDREINYTFPDIDDYTEGLFPGRTTLTSVTIGSQVRTLSPYMFALSNITSITIPGTVTSIGRNVFDACSALTTLTFGESETPLVIMGQGDSDGPFYDSPLTTINYNRNFTYMEVDGEDERTYDDDSDGIFAISEEARDRVTTTSTVNIGDLIQNIPDRMFCNLAITELTIPGTVTSIGNNVFNGCNRLATLTFEPSETSPVTDLTLGYNSDGAQEGPFLNSPITSVNLNREISYTLASINLDYDDEGIFYGKSLTEGVIIGEQVRTLSDYMFSASGINSLSIPATLTKIGAYTFNNCTNLATLTFEGSTTPLEIMGQGDSDGPFYDSPLTTINYNRNFVYKKVNGEEFIPSDDSDGIFAISNDAKNKITGKSVVTIGELIQTIPDYMCNNLAITELTIPNTVANLGMHAFLNCDRLSNITIQDDTNSLNLQTQRYSAMGPFYNSPLTDIYLGREILYNGEDYKPGMSESGIFYSEKSAKVDKVNLSISNKVKTISPFMFAHLNLKSITIPASIISIGLNAFFECQSLNSIVFEDTNTPLKVCYCHNNASAKGPFYQSPLTSITLGRKINYVDSDGNPFTPSETDDGFFASEDTVESLSITLTNNVQTISEYMFAGRPIIQINIPASVTEIKDHAFQSCTKLASLTIPGTVNTIGNDVFNECISLASLTFAPSPDKTPLTLGYNTEGEDDGPFLNSPLTRVNLNRQINYDLEKDDLDADDEGIFSGRPLTDGVTIGEQVERFSKYMFSCSGIKSLTIPANVVEIADHVFSGCEALASISFNESATPITIGYQPGTNEHGPFYQSPLTSIYVNREIVPSEAYRNARDADDEGIFSTPSNSRNVSVTLQGNVNTISDYMFSGVQMGTIWIPSEVTSIGKEAFEDCSKLYGVTLAHSNPPTLGVDAFDGTKLQDKNATRWIALEDATNINAFKTADNWSEYAGIIIAQIKQ